MRRLMSNGRVPKPSTRSSPNIPLEPISGDRTGQEILRTDNVEIRRIQIERLGYETFLQQVGGIIRDRDTDAGGERQLICIPFEDDEPLMLLKVVCPSTGHIHVLRVPPSMDIVPRSKLSSLNRSRTVEGTASPLHRQCKTCHRGLFSPHLLYTASPPRE
jgi:hypothetical protein